MLKFTQSEEKQKEKIRRKADLKKSNI